MPTAAWKSGAVGFGLLLAALGPVGLVHAQTNPNGTKQNGSNQNSNPQNVDLAATPELDSLALLSAGAIGIASYAVLRQRAKKKT